jgi:hypothetical protein
MKKQGIKFKMGSKVTGAEVVDGAVTQCNIVYTF